VRLTRGNFALHHVREREPLGCDVEIGPLEIACRVLCTVLCHHASGHTVLDALRARALSPLVWTGLHLERPPLRLRICEEMPGHGTVWQVGLWSNCG